MSVNAIAHLATSLASAKTADAVGVAVLKTAMNSQRASAAALLDALPPPMPKPPEGRVGTQFSASA